MRLSVRSNVEMEAYVSMDAEWKRGVVYLDAWAAVRRSSAYSRLIGSAGRKFAASMRKEGLVLFGDLFVPGGFMCGPVGDAISVRLA